MPPVKTPDEIKAQLAGPVNSIPTTFLPDGHLDWEGIGNTIDTGISGGSAVSLLTYGDSQYDFLSGYRLGRADYILGSDGGVFLVRHRDKHPLPDCQPADFCADLDDLADHRITILNRQLEGHGLVHKAPRVIHRYRAVDPHFRTSADRCHPRLHHHAIRSTNGHFHLFENRLSRSGNHQSFHRRLSCSIAAEV